MTPPFRLAALALLLAVVPAARAQAPVYTSMYADPKARQVGDVLTVVLAERTSAQRESGWQNRSDARVGANGDVSAGTLSGAFGADAQFDKQARNNNESVQSDLLKGTLTALVTGVDEATGNLVVEGERRLSVNGEEHVLKVAGIVRPYDIKYDNTLYSFQIANAQIEYRRAGLHRKFFKPALLTRAGAFIALGAAVGVALMAGD